MPKADHLSSEFSETDASMPLASEGLPRGWKQARLEDVATVQTGLAKGKSVAGNSLELPYLRVANVQDGFVDLSVVKTVVVSASDAERYKLRAGDVLFTEGGDFDKLGRGTVWNGQIANCLHQNHVFAVRPDPKLLPEYLAALASSPAGRRYFQLSSKQSTNLASINSSQLKAFPLPLPPLEEQRLIAAVLRTWDEAIDAADRLRIAGAKRASFVSSRMYSPTRSIGGVQPQKGWIPCSLGQAFTERTDRNGDMVANDVVTVGKYRIRKQADHFSRSVASKDLAPYWTISPGDFVYDPMSAYYGALGRYEGSRDGLVSPAYRVIRLADHINPEFMVGLLKCHHIRFQLDALSSQGNKLGKRRSLQREAFESVEFFLPPPQEQKRIADVIADFSSGVVATERYSAALRQQKRGLMQKLLTGEWRTNVADRGDRTDG